MKKIKLNEAELRNLIYEKVKKALNEDYWSDIYGDSDPNEHECDFLGGGKWRYKGKIFDSFDAYIDARSKDDFHDGWYWLNGSKYNYNHYRGWVFTWEHQKFEKEVMSKNNNKTFEVKASEITKEFIKNIIGSYSKKKYIGAFPEIKKDGTFAYDNPDVHEQKIFLKIDEIEDYIRKVIARYGDLDATIRVECPMYAHHYNDELMYSYDYSVDFDEEERNNIKKEYDKRVEQGWGDYVSREMAADAALGKYTD